MVKLLRPYSTYATGTVVTLAPDTEAALVAQGLATTVVSTSAAYTGPGGFQTETIGGNANIMAPTGLGPVTTPNGPSIVPCIPLTAFAAAGTSTVQIAGTINLTEVFVPAPITVANLRILAGATVGTDNWLAALYGSNGQLLANSALAGQITANANTFQVFPLLQAITIPAGRYFVGLQSNGATDTSRRLKAADSPNVLTGSLAGVFGTLPAQLTAAQIPSAFTDVIGAICAVTV